MFRLPHPSANGNREADLAPEGDFAPKPFLGRHAKHVLAAIVIQPETGRDARREVDHALVGIGKQKLEPACPRRRVRAEQDVTLEPQRAIYSLQPAEMFPGLARLVDALHEVFGGVRAVELEQAPRCVFSHDAGAPEMPWPAGLTELAGPSVHVVPGEQLVGPFSRKAASPRARDLFAAEQQGDARGVCGGKPGCAHESGNGIEEHVGRHARFHELGAQGPGGFGRFLRLAATFFVVADAVGPLCAGKRQQVRRVHAARKEGAGTAGCECFGALRQDVFQRLLDVVNPLLLGA